MPLMIGCKQLSDGLSVALIQDFHSFNAKCRDVIDPEVITVEKWKDRNRDTQIVP